MLNISSVSIKEKINEQKYPALLKLKEKNASNMMVKVILAIALLGVICLFLPWTQNVRAKGFVNTLNPYDRPQAVQSIIDGKIEKWLVREGAFVDVGDTILILSEVKEDYLDPFLLERTQNQIDAKNSSQKAYEQKASSLNQQAEALAGEKRTKLKQNELKYDQTKSKIEADSADFKAQTIQLEIAERQLRRAKQLLIDGIKSRKDVESKEKLFQKEKVSLQKIKNGLEVLKNELNVIEANRNAITFEYDNKIFKANADQEEAMSGSFSQSAEADKLNSSLNKYRVRTKNYVLRSPIKGTITKSIKGGIGELIKAGENVVSVVPFEYDLAAEVFVEPMDMPLLEKGQKVQIQFDGWPAVVFSGWPNNSYGTFTGRIFAIDQFISSNGKYRLLISQDPDEEKWPEQVRVGGGMNSIILLNEVPVYYELWRQMNGFPPDYYKNEKKQEDFKNKAPIRKFKP